MQIKPIQPVQVLLKCNQGELHCDLVEFSEIEITLTSTEFINKESLVLFKSKFFTGEGIISQIHYSHYLFTYNITIGDIKYQPGMIINTFL